MRKKLSKYLCNKYHIPTKTPWIIDPNYFSNSKIIYNSVGGELINNSNDYNKMLKSTYVSVRDNRLNKYENKFNLFPDSATIMSDLYDEKFLLNHISDEVKNITMKNEEYICFQVNSR